MADFPQLTKQHDLTLKHINAPQRPARTRRQPTDHRPRSMARPPPRPESPTPRRPTPPHAAGPGIHGASATRSLGPGQEIPRPRRHHDANPRRGPREPLLRLRMGRPETGRRRAPPAARPPRQRQARKGRPRKPARRHGGQIRRRPDRRRQSRQHRPSASFETGLFRPRAGEGKRSDARAW